MALYNKELEKQVHQLFMDLQDKSSAIVANARTTKDATERIMRLVSSAVSAEAEGYLIDVYASLVEKVKSEEYFRNPDKMNDFYRLNLREEINEKYQFNIENIDAYKKGIEYTEINRVYAAVGAAAGTLAFGGILKCALAGVIKIPFAVVVAGALVVACAAFFAAPSRNKKEYKKAICKFLNSLENDILDWFVDIEVYFDERVRSLYK